MISKNKLFIIFSLFCLSGIFINNLLEFSFGYSKYYSYIMILIVGIIFLCHFLLKRKFLAYIFASILGLLIGIIISQICISNIYEKEMIIHKFTDEKKHTFQVEIQETYKIQDFSSQYIGKIIHIDHQNITKNILMVVTVPNNFTLQKGDNILGISKLSPFENSEDFAYKNYMFSKNIFLESYLRSFKTLYTVPQNIIEKQIYKIREKVLEIIEKLYPKDEGIFLGGILIGARENLPKELKINFNNSGLTHFMAVSGFNITILIVFLSYALKYVPRIIRVIIVTTTIVGFTILVGDTAPVLRASITGVIGYYILSSGRQGSVISILLFTGLLMVILSPFSINYDVSLHLSFLAVIGILYTQNFFSRIFSFLPETLEIKSAFVLTLAAMSFTLPIMVFNFGQLSIMSPFANIAVSWTIPLAMLTGFLSIIVYFVFPVLGYIIAYITWIFLKWDIMMVYFFGQLDWAILKFDFGVYKYHIQILYFALLIFCIVYFRKKEKSH